MTHTGHVTVLCGASGTGLSALAARIDDLPGCLAADVERRICSTYRGDARLGIEPEVDPTMEIVARQPRHELHERWKAVVTDALTEGREHTGPAVITLHLSWYNSDTNEFFSPVDAGLIARSGASIAQVVIVVDDIFDMYHRLQAPNDLYGARSQANVSSLLARLGVKRESLKTPAAAKRLDAQLELEAVEHAAQHLLSWRRAEMLQAENLAYALGAQFTVLGVKHSFSALAKLVTDPDLPKVYLSHRITEVRSMNIETSNLPIDLGAWEPVADEVNDLHSELIDSNILLINPTAIDELRFGPPLNRSRRNRYLASRWPLPRDIASTMWLPPSAGHQHTTILDHEVLGPCDALPSSIARALANRIFFEIAFRDHVIVEHTAGLCVFRPFFQRDPGKHQEADWSGGVRPEIFHWREKALVSDTTRRVAFVHTGPEINSRLKWLYMEDNFDRMFGRPLRVNLRHLLDEAQFPSDEIDAVLEDSGHHAERVTQLAANPRSFIFNRRRSLVRWIETAAIIALQTVFTSLERRPSSLTPLAPSFDVALITATEGERRQLLDLANVSAQLAAFFSGQESGTQLSRGFWSMHDDVFLDIFEVTPSERAFSLLRIDRAELEDG